MARGRTRIQAPLDEFLCHQRSGSSGAAEQENRQLFRIRAHVSHGLGETVAVIRRQVVLANRVRKRIVLDTAECSRNDQSRIHPPICPKIGGFHPVLEPTPKIEWHGRSAATDDNAAKTLWLEGRGEEQCSGANVGTDGVGILEPKCVRKSNNELAHRARRQKRVAPLLTAPVAAQLTALTVDGPEDLGRWLRWAAKQARLERLDVYPFWSEAWEPTRGFAFRFAHVPEIPLGPGG